MRLASATIFLFVWVNLWVYGQTEEPWSAQYAAQRVADAWRTLPERLAQIETPNIQDRELVFDARPRAKDHLPALQQAIDQLSEEGGGRILIPTGMALQLQGPIHLRSGVHVHLEAGSSLNFSDDPTDYLPVVEVRWEGTSAYNYSPLIYAKDQTDIALTGSGTIYGNGRQWSTDWREQQDAAKDRLRTLGSQGAPMENRIFGPGYYLRPGLLQFYNCQRVLIEGLTFKDSPFWTIHLPFSQDATIRGVSIYGSTLNDDGIDPDSSQDVLIENCYIETHDDAISIKAGRDRDGWDGPSSRNIIIRRCQLNSGVNAFAIGSELSGGIAEVFVEDVKIMQGRRALTIKTNSDRGGYVKDVFIRNIMVDSLGKSLLAFRTDYHGYRGGQAPTQVSDVYVTQVKANHIAGPAVSLVGLPENPIHRVFTDDFELAEAQMSVTQNAYELFLPDNRRIGPPGELEEAVHTGADYAVEVLITDEGYSRCDYDWLSGQWHEYEAAWHTGQVIYGLLHAYRLTGEERYLQTAKRAGDWWLTLEIGPERPELEGYLAAVHAGPVGAIINFTTIADGTPGLYELSRVTGDDRYADAATRSADWALEHLYLEDEGLIIDLVELETGEIWRDKSPFFSGELSVHEIARPNNEGFLFYDAYLHTGEQRFYDAFVGLCNSLVDKQDSSGFWLDYHPNRRSNGKIHPRSNTWYAESLIKGYELTQDKRYLEAAAHTARALAALQQYDGGMYYHNYLSPKTNNSSMCGSAVSFAGLLWLELQAHGYTEFDLPIELARSWVLANRFPVDHPDPNLRGAFLETRRYRRPDGVVVNVRDIATAFGLRFLVRYDELLNPKTVGQ
ncbi:MAG: glycosyl hydrolase family 28 protein [Bacteroidota bacterium]